MKDTTENLLAETLEIMEANGKGPADVEFVSGRGKWWRDAPPELGTWADFEALADFDYDSGYGGAEVDTSLVVVFTDGSWLERGEYDGSEWWEFKRTPTRPENPIPLTNLLDH